MIQPSNICHENVRHKTEINDDSFEKKTEYLATFHIIGLVGYSKPINGLIAAASGALVC